MSDRPRTYFGYELVSLMPATGWQAVYYDEPQGHWLMEVHALALAEQHTYDLPTHRRVVQYAHEQREDRLTVVGLSYNPSDGWNIMQDDSNYCGLLPPGWTLEQFEGYDHCQHSAKEQAP